VERSRTPWRKSRTFGDIYGGRLRRRMTDNIFERLHSLSPPGPLDDVPIVINENPSRDFVFPATARDVLERCREMPDATLGITHLWLRRVSGERFETRVPLAEFICGSGVRVIVLYPWRADLRMPFGSRRPSLAALSSFSKWTTDLRQIKGSWWLVWDAESARAYTLDYLLAHEIGHHLDWYRNRWTPANRSTTERRADSYAVQWDANKTIRTDAPAVTK
jgi:hypothetical protein